jgi:hypothetical protein
VGLLVWVGCVGLGDEVYMGMGVRMRLIETFWCCGEAVGNTLLLKFHTQFRRVLDTASV